MKKRNKLIAVVMAAVLLIGIFGAAFVPVSAAGSVYPPQNLYWDGFVGHWSAPPSGLDPIYYCVDLYFDGSYVDSAYPSSTYVDFSSLIQGHGAGHYFFSVASSVGTDTGDTSEYVSSSVFYYDGGSSSHHLIHIPFQYPTCTTDGEKGHYECSDCGKWFWDSEAKNEITNYMDTRTAKYGHSWGEWTITKQPTTEQEGEAKRVCKNDANHVEYKELPKLKNSNDKATVPATEKTTVPPTTQEYTANPSMPTEPSTLSPDATHPTVSTLPSGVIDPGNGNSGGFGGFIHDNPWVLIVGIAAILLIMIAVPLIIILIIVSKKKKGRNTPNPPTNPPSYPPQNPPYPQGYPQNPPRNYPQYNPQNPPVNYPQNSPQQTPDLPQDFYDDSFN